MIAHYDNQLALRARLLTLAGPTTGSTSLSATATGYARASGSFLTDGFKVGMEVTASGFGTAANNGTGRITAVAALTMSVTAYTLTADTTEHGYTKTDRTLVVEVASTGRTLAVHLPTHRAWENTRFAPIADIPFVEEQYLAGALTKATLGSFGELEATPLYVVKLASPAGTGIGALARLVDELIEHFAPNTPVTVGSDRLLVRADVAPSAAPMVLLESGHMLATVTIPCRIRTANSR